MRTIPPFKLVPVPTKSRVALPSLAPAAPRFNKGHQLGGTPEFIEPGQEIPKCQYGQPTTFYAQLDSMSEEFMLADRGMIYVFVCFDCFETVAVLQSR
jgi:hypothetical protein